MAYVNHNGTLEYATNTLEFWLYDDADEVPFDAGTTFSIERIDNPGNNYSVGGTREGNKVTFVVTPPTSLQSGGDNLYSYETPEYAHIYSVKSGSKVYISGKLNLVEVA